MTAPLEFEVLTLFPAIIEAFVDGGLLGRATRRDLLRVRCTDFRDFVAGRYRSVDDAPFGGGAGMTMAPEPVVAALEHVERVRGAAHKVLLTPAAPRFDQSVARRLAEQPRIALICGRYEGIDDRVREHFVDECISIGDYVLNGGEVAAAVIIEAVARLQDGVLGNQASIADESFGGASRPMLEYPQYTRPAIFRGFEVPEVLRSGHHAGVHRWRIVESVRRTHELRPELLDPIALGPTRFYFAVEGAVSGRQMLRLGQLASDAGAVELLSSGPRGARSEVLSPPWCRNAGALPPPRDLRGIRRDVRRREGVVPWIVGVAMGVTDVSSPVGSMGTPVVGPLDLCLHILRALQPPAEVSDAAVLRPLVFVLDACRSDALHAPEASLGGYDALVRFGCDTPSQTLAHGAGIGDSSPRADEPLNAKLAARLGSELRALG
ncbi:MAG: tRNA (guanosine(37)-N1)-methyltransferase TrmD [Nannocystaceae bacterium]